MSEESKRTIEVENSIVLLIRFFKFEPFSRYFRLKRIRRPNVPLRPSPVYIGQSNELLNTQFIIADPLEIDIKRIKYIKQIGQGEFGQVYRAFLSNKDFSNHYVVAVKTLKGDFMIFIQPTMCKCY